MPNKTFNIKYQKTHDYKTSFVTGIHGGLSSNGMITASFLADRHALPEVAILELDEKNNVIRNEDVKGSDMVREVPFGVVMDINTTKLIINWLSLRVKEYEERVK